MDTPNQDMDPIIPDEDSIPELPPVNKKRNSNKAVKQEEKEMAENGMYWDPTLHAEHSNIRYELATESADIQAGQGDIRREQAGGFGDTRYNIASNAGDIRREVAKEACDLNGSIKDARQGILSGVESSADRVSDRMMELRGLIGQRFHEVSHDLATVKQGQATLAKDVELNALKTQLDAAKNTTYLSDKLTAENEKTRDLISDLKYHDLNRGLVERNTELVECQAERRDWRYRADQSQFAGQWAQLQSQIQAFQSQLQETRQGMVNFGTMAGVGQTSTSNNVR